MTILGTVLRILTILGRVTFLGMVTILRIWIVTFLEQAGAELGQAQLKLELELCWYLVDS